MKEQQAEEVKGKDQLENSSPEVVDGEVINAEESVMSERMEELNTEYCISTEKTNTLLNLNDLDKAEKLITTELDCMEDETDEEEEDAIDQGADKECEEHNDLDNRGGAPLDLTPFQHSDRSIEITQLYKGFKIFNPNNSYINIPQLTCPPGGKICEYRTKDTLVKFVRDAEECRFDREKREHTIEDEILAAKQAEEKAKQAKMFAKRHAKKQNKKQRDKKFTPSKETAKEFLEKQFPLFYSITDMFGPSKEIQEKCMQNKSVAGELEIELYRQEKYEEMALKGPKTIQLYLTRLHQFKDYIVNIRKEIYQAEKHNTCNYMHAFLEYVNKKDLPAFGDTESYTYFSTSALMCYLASFLFLFKVFHNKPITSDMHYSKFDITRKKIIKTIQAKHKKELLMGRRAKSTITYHEYQTISEHLHDQLCLDPEEMKKKMWTMDKYIKYKIGKKANPINHLVFLQMSYAGFHRCVTTLNIAFSHFHLLEKELPDVPYASNFLCVDRAEQKVKTSNKELDRTMFYRHKDPFLCPVLAIAMKMFLLLRNEENLQELSIDVMLEKEKDIDIETMKSSELWISHQFLDMSYQTVSSGLKTIFDEQKISISAVTHVPRRLAAIHTQDKGCSKTEIADSGGWTIGAETNGINRYIRSTSHNVCKVLAGFELSERYDVPRTEIEVPPLLKTQVFNWLSTRTASENLTHVLDVLNFLSEVLLQDLPFVFEKYPNHVLKQFYPFNSKLFNNHASQTIKRFSESQEVQLNASSLQDEKVASLMYQLIRQNQRKLNSFPDLDKVAMTNAGNYLNFLHNSMREETKTAVKEITQESKHSAMETSSDFFSSILPLLGKILNMVNALYAENIKTNENFDDLKMSLRSETTASKQPLETGETYVSNKPIKRSKIEQEVGAIQPEILIIKPPVRFIQPKFDIPIRDFLYEWLIGFLPAENQPLILLKSPQFKKQYPSIKLEKSLSSSFKNYIRVARLFDNVFHESIMFKGAAAIEEMIMAFKKARMMDKEDVCWAEKAFASPATLATFLKSGKGFASVKEREDAASKLLIEMRGKQIVDTEK